MKFILKFSVIYLFMLLPLALFSVDIFEVAEAGDTLTVQKLIESGEASVKDADAYLKTPLHLASAKGKTETAAYLIKKGADVNSRSRNGMTPLHFAVIGGYIDTARLLLSNNAKSTIGDKAGFGMKPIHYACINNNVPILKMLIEEFGVDVNTTDLNGTTVLMYAARRSNLDAAKYLISKGADPNRTDNFSHFSHMTALDYATYNLTVETNKAILDMIAFLESCGAKSSREADKK